MGNKKNKRFKKDPKLDTNRFSYNPEVETKIIKHNHPIFCFRYQHPDYNIDNCDDQERLSLINQINKLSQLDWQRIEYSGRHGLGTEKINVGSLKEKLPKYITEDVSFLLAFRFHNKMPFLVHRDQFVAHVIFVDPKGKCYNH